MDILRRFWTRLEAALDQIDFDCYQNLVIFSWTTIALLLSSVYNWNFISTPLIVREAVPSTYLDIGS